MVLSGTVFYKSVVLDATLTAPMAQLYSAVRSGLPARSSGETGKLSSGTQLVELRAAVTQRRIFLLQHDAQPRKGLAHLAIECALCQVPA